MRFSKYSRLTFSNVKQIFLFQSRAPMLVQVITRKEKTFSYSSPSCSVNNKLYKDLT